MKITNIKQRLSLKNIWQSLQRVVLRFPIIVSFLLALTILLFAIVINADIMSRGVGCLIYFLSVGILIDFTASLWGEEQSNKRPRWIAEGVSLALWAAYCIWLYLTDLTPNSTPAFFLGNAAWIAGVILVMPFVSFFKERDDLKAWHLIMALCVALLLSGVVSGVMTGGLEGLIYGTAALFDLSVNDKLPVVIMIVCMVLLLGMLVLALVPYSERKHNSSQEMSSFLMKIVSWLLLPLLCCYILVLYAYGINILVHWELPKGMISFLVSAVMIGYLLCYILLYPKVLDRQSWQSRMLTRWLPIAILPLLVLMTVGVIRRFADYGVTPPRLYLLTLLLWFYAVCIIMLAVPQKRFRWIFLSFAALFLLSSGHPLNYYNLYKPFLTAKIEKVIADKQLSLPFISTYSVKSNPSLTQEEADELYDNLTYMRTNYGERSVARWIDYNSDNDGIAEPEPKVLWETYYDYDSDRKFACPQGFVVFSTKNHWDEITLPEDSIRGGVLHAPVRLDGENYVLLFDTAAVRLAEEKKESIVIPSSDGNAAYVMNEVIIRQYDNHIIKISRLYGFLFTKETIFGDSKRY